MFCETCELTVLDEAKLYEVGYCMIRMMCGMLLVDRVPNDVPRDRVGVVLKIKDMIMQIHLQSMVMSFDKISPPKYVRVWSLKQLANGSGVNQGNCEKSA